MAIDVLSPACRFLTLVEIQKKFNLSAERARTFLKMLGVPVLRYVERHFPESTTNLQELVLAPAFEAALFANMMPGGPGIEIPDPNLPPVVDSLPEAVYNLSGAFRVLDYWDLFKRNPQAIHLVIALCHLMYGSISEKELKARLWALGDLLLADVTRHRHHTASDKVEGEQKKFAQERRDDMEIFGPKNLEEAQDLVRREAHPGEQSDPGEDNG